MKVGVEYKSFSEPYCERNERQNELVGSLISMM
jgi:hypothetical protein